MQRIGGVSRSYAELISHCRDKGCDCIVGVKESDNVYLREKRLVSKIKPLNYRHDLLFEGKKLFKGQRTLTRKALSLLGETNDCLKVNKEYCLKLLKKQRFDIFEPTFLDAYFLPFLKDKPFVMTVHDMIPELFPEYFAKDDYQIMQKKLLCPLAAQIHVPSKKTKADLVNILNVDPEKITVIPHGKPMYGTHECLWQPLIGFPYLLYVGERGGYKNFSAFIQECSHIIKEFPDIRVVCTGKGFNVREKMELSSLGIRANVVHKYVDEKELRNLYHYAIAFVYPSAYEGFGIPILEAFANDCPVMLNNASCFPEVAGEAAIFFDIKKRGDFYEKFMAFYQSGADMRERIIEKGRLQVEKYSWEKSADALMTIYRSLS